MLCAHCGFAALERITPCPRCGRPTDGRRDEPVAVGAAAPANTWTPVAPPQYPTAPYPAPQYAYAPAPYRADPVRPARNGTSTTAFVAAGFGVIAPILGALGILLACMARSRGEDRWKAALAVNIASLIISICVIVIVRST